MIQGKIAMISGTVFSMWCLLALTPATGALAAPAADAPADSTVTRLADLTVIADGGPIWGEGRVPQALLDREPGGNLGEILENLPGVAAVRRSATGTEPVIRGLGWERVLTVVGAVPLYGACPARMDPPATYLSPFAFTDVAVRRAGGALDFGPGATGGAIMADPDYERPAGAGDGMTSFLAGGFASATEGYHVQGGAYGGTGKLDVKADGGHRASYDYQAPDGTVVPAGLSSANANLALGLRLSPERRLWGAVSFTHEENIDFPALPMDNIDTDFRVANLGYRCRRDGATVRTFELTGGFSGVDHLMDNSMKPSAAMMDNSTNVETRTWGAHARAELAPHRSLELTVGLDGTGLSRDAIRTRRSVATGMAATDHLWPDARQTNLGGFARTRLRLGPEARLTVEGRLDGIDSKARAADAASLGGRTVVEQWVVYYGEAAADHDRTETLGAASVTLSYDVSSRAAAYLRGGLSSRAAGITERFYAFGAAPGGFQVGNPTLKAEKKRELEAGLTWQDGPVTAAFSGFVAKVDDFILGRVIDRRDVNGDGVADVIKGFTGIEARLYGGEFGLELRPAERMRIPVTVAYVRGENRTDGGDLPEIPPLSGTADVRWLAERGANLWFGFGLDFAADQDKIDPLFGENRTPGFAIWHAGLTAGPVSGVKFNLLLDNIFDRLYHDHLTREALLPTGGLAAGQEIPAPGRNVRLSARIDF